MIFSRMSLIAALALLPLAACAESGARPYPAPAQTIVPPTANPLPGINQPSPPQTPSTVIVPTEMPAQAPVV